MLRLVPPQVAGTNPRPSLAGRGFLLSCFTRGHDQRDARGRLQARRSLRACRQGHLHRHRHREHNRHEDTTADACCCEAEADSDSQEGTGGKGDESDANEARGGNAIKLTLATSAGRRPSP